MHSGMFLILCESDINTRDELSFRTSFPRPGYVMCTAGNQQHVTNITKQTSSSEEASYKHKLSSLEGPGARKELAAPVDLH